MTASTPVAISATVTDFCKAVSPTGTPVYLDVTPDADADQLDCTNIVDNAVAERGGASCLGWQIWEWPGVLLEAEFHAVWRDEAGQLHDLTPKPLASIRRIVFLPDPRIAYAGRQIPSVRRAQNPDKRIVELFKLQNAEFDLMNRGARAEQHREIRLEGDEARAFRELSQKKLLTIASLETSPPVTESTADDKRRARNGRKRRTRAGK